MEHKHFSHPHVLGLYQAQPSDQVRCSGCESPCSGSVYGCVECLFYLDELCFNAKRFMNHPSHPSHHLTFLPCPTYNHGSFGCKACGGGGTAFSYGCALCEYDLHVQCASMPPTLRHNSHPHDLSLCYALPQHQAYPPPYYSNTNQCKICQTMMDPKLWSYGCSTCNFYVHVNCANMRESTKSSQSSQVKNVANSILNSLFGKEGASAFKAAFREAKNGAAGGNGGGGGKPSSAGGGGFGGSGNNGGGRGDPYYDLMRQEQENILSDMRVKMHQNQIARMSESIDMMGEIGTTHYRRQPYYYSSSSSITDLGRIG